MYTSLLVGTVFMLTGVLLAANDATSGIKAAAEKQAGRHGRKLEHAAAGALSNAAQHIDKEVGNADSAATHEARKAEHAAQRAASHAEKKIGTLGQAVRNDVADGEKEVVKSAKELVPAAKDVVPPTTEITKPAASAIDALGKVAPLSGAVVTNLGVAMDASTPVPPAAAPVVAPPTAAPAPADAVKAAAPAPAAPARKKWWKFWSKD
ncbi:MAG: hypothetical protein NTV22_08680 [bacterium]|nr:hypothetical protein [bacterium]